MQRIEVKNFGPLKDLSLDIRDYMVFIGPQASGKSTLAKLIYFSKVIEVQRYLLLVRFGAAKLTQNEIPVKPFTSGFSKTIRDIFGHYFKEYFLSEYEFTIFYNGYSILFRNNNFELSPNFFNEFSFIDEKLSYILSSLPSRTDQRIGIRSLSSYVENITNYSFDNYGVNIKQDNIFIPSQRYFTSFPFEYDLNNQILRDYKKFIESTNPYSLSGITSESDFHEYKEILLDLSRKILKGEYAYTNEKKVIYYDKDKYVDLSEASSGQQEAVWIIEAVKDIFVSLSLNDLDSYDLIIEEPETHLFPEAQRYITYLISLLANQPDSQVIITTHSPYVLAALNNLLKAFSVGHQEGKKELVKDIVSPLLWINPDRFYVGYMNQGTIKDIFDHGTNLIKHEMLDRVSDDIMEEFDQLLEIQYE